MKTCRMCELEKPRDAFYRDATKALGLRNECRGPLYGFERRSHCSFAIQNCVWIARLGKPTTCLEVLQLEQGQPILAGHAGLIEE